MVHRVMRWFSRFGVVPRLLCFVQSCRQLKTSSASYIYRYMWSACVRNGCGNFKERCTVVRLSYSQQPNQFWHKKKKPRW